MVVKITLAAVILSVIISFSHPANTFAESGDLLFTIENPGLKKDMFSSSLDTLNDLIVVGASGKEVDGVVGAGSLYVFDGITGELKFTIDNPDPKRGDGFGRHMITTDNYIAVGLGVDNKGDMGHKGKIFVFDETGSLHHTIENPNGPIHDEWFADQISSHHDKIISGSMMPVTKGDPIYMTHVFDKSGKLQHTLKNSESDIAMFGYSASSFGDSIAVYVMDEDPNDDTHTNSIHVFDASDGKLRYVIENPDPTKGDFGRDMAEVQNHLVVGTTTRLFEETSGTIHIFDDTGNLRSSVQYPESNLTNAHFGERVTDIGDIYFALRSTSDQTDHDSLLPLSDLVHVFDVLTGSLVMTIDESSVKDENRSFFIASMESTGNFAISGLNRNVHNPLDKTIHVFEGPRKMEINYVDLPDTESKIVEEDYSFLVFALIAVLTGFAISTGAVIFWKKRKQK
ncbi:lactonase family protein [archaeon]|nr:lactonase family protein [archaeon]